MNRQTYHEYWIEKGKILYMYTPPSSDKLAASYEFFTEWGLPSDAAPYLSFSELQQNRLETPNKVFELDFEELEKYLMFGSDGSGDPICIDLRNNGAVVALNHDNNFAEVFVNEDITKFALCIILYRDFLALQYSSMPESYTKRAFNDDELTALKTNFVSIDPKCLDDNCFWKYEMDNLEWEKDNQ